MMALLTNVAPIILGFVAKLFALKSQAAAENQIARRKNGSSRQTNIKTLFTG